MLLEEHCLCDSLCSLTAVWGIAGRKILVVCMDFASANCALVLQRLLLMELPVEHCWY